MRRGRAKIAAVRAALALCLLLRVTAEAGAETYVVQRGETLEHVAAAHGCSVEAVMRANRLRTTLVRAGTEVEVPACSLRTRARTRTPRDAGVSAPDSRSKPTSEDDKARAALAVIDGATWIAEPAPVRALPPVRGPRARFVETARMPDGGEGYLLRRPSRAYGEAHVIEHLRSSIAVVRALYPDVHTLAIGDISAQHGGKLDNHVSHQTGLDVDVGFYFRMVPEGYPDRFVGANANLDLEATWALVTAFARTASVDDGVSIIFLDYAVQRRLYDWAYERGTPDEDLASLLQYPRSKDTQVGLVRHWPNHADHLHVRFKATSR